MNARIVPAADVRQGDLILWGAIGICRVSAIDHRGGATLSWILTSGETSRQVAGVGLSELVAVVTESEDE